MRSNIKTVLALVTAVLGVTVWILFWPNDGADIDSPATSLAIEGDAGNASESDVIVDFGAETNDRQEMTADSLEPLDVSAFREDRGYYMSGGNDAGSGHAYQYYDDTTLRGLAEQHDGLAQLVLADRISNEDLGGAVPLYLEATVNGKTAALINLASSQLVVNPGQRGFGFEMKTASGDISTEFAEILKYYAAAEYLGDFVGTTMLVDHLESAGLHEDATSVRTVCSMGQGVARNILSIRESRQIRSANQEIDISSVDIPNPICN